MTGRDVFVSYSQSDRDLALEVVAQIESRGINCWVAPRDITPASDWAAEIIDAIASVRVMVLVFSASANSSPQVRREVERAIHRRVAVLPLRAEDVLPTGSMEYFLSSQHWLDVFPPPREPHFDRLCAHLKKILADGSAAIDAGTSRGGYEVGVPAATAEFAARELDRVQAALALYVGPIAKHLMKRAALRATDLEDLIRRLATEIASEDDRRQFLDVARGSHAVLAER